MPGDGSNLPGQSRAGRRRLGTPLAANGQREELRREVGEGESAPPPLPAKKQLVIQQFLLSDSITFPVSLLLRPPLITSFHQGSSLSRLKRKQPATPDGPFSLLF